ncbi:MAG: transcription elongation factor GreA [bacterium]|nr:transcription elongation factor GreA [bacterium]
MANNKVIEKLESLFKEEVWGRIEPKDIGISKFKILDDIFNTVVSGGMIDNTLEVCKAHQDEHSHSITAAYLIGQIGYHLDRVEDSQQLRKLIDIFVDNHKWAVVEILADKILEYGESSVALRALAICLERLGRSKEAIPAWENLLKIDRFDAEVSKKLAFAIFDEEPDKSIHYMKLSIEGFIKIKNYDEIGPLWNKLVSISWEDIPFFERIERMLVEAKQMELTGNLLKVLLAQYRNDESLDQPIKLLKKILEYRPQDTHARKELVRLYGLKYGEHSQFDQFMKLSKLNNFKIPVKFAIQDFEKNIVFDVGNYVFHNSWKLGKILDINSEKLVLTFRDKPEHNMSIQMGLQSLTPLPKDHMYVLEYEDPDTLKSLFDEDFMQFFEVLIKSYGGTIILADIKREITTRYVDAKVWGKWWNKARTKIKKDPLFGVSEKKKDLIYMRDKPVTFAEELLGQFTRTESFTEKLNIAIEFINNNDKSEGASVVQYFIDYFTAEMKGKSETRQVLSYFALKGLAGFLDPGKVKLDPIRAKVIAFIKESQDLHLISMKISSYDYKKDFVNLIEEAREDWPQVVSEMLFETPVRIHKYIINNLMRGAAYSIINNFIDRVITGAKQYPEIFVWIAKNLFNKTWDYEWLDFSREGMTIAYFRLMNEMKKLETEGNRLKNMTLDILFDNEAHVLKDIVQDFDQGFLGKVYDLFSNLPYIEETHSEKFMALINERFEGFEAEQLAAEEDWGLDVEKLIVTQEGFERKKLELDRMVNVEMVNLSRELSKVSEVSSDLRENVEYNALLEKQSILKMAISKLDDEMKKADILDIETISVDTVNVGTKVVFEDVQSGEKNNYAILGPWDADFENGILSYRSPIARSLLGTKLDGEFKLKINDEDRNFKVVSIERI